MAMPSFMGGLTGAATDLGLGSMLQDQVAGETEEQRKKRMLEQQQRSLMGPGSSLAVPMLFGVGANGLRSA